MKNISRFYYSKLQENEKIVYDKFFTGFYTQESEISTSVPDLHQDNIEKIIDAVLSDNSIIFNVDKRSFEYLMRRNQIILRPNYIYSKNETYDLYTEIKRKTSEIINKIIRNNMSQFEKELAVHDFLIDYINYNYKALSSPRDEYDSYTIIGALLKGSAVCEGISKLSKLLFDNVGIKSIVITGTSKQPQTHKNSNHAWNMIKIGEQSYHVDITWDNTIKSSCGSKCYDYLNLSDKDMLLDHIWDLKLYPKCVSQEYNYFKLTGKLISSTMLKSYLTNALSRGKKDIYFKVTGSPISHTEMMNCVNECINNNYSLKRSSYNIVYNKPQLVYRIIKTI